MKTTLFVALAFIATATTAAGQSATDVQVSIYGLAIGATGGEQRIQGRFLPTLEIDTPMVRTIEIEDKAGPCGSVQRDWSTEVTPHRVAKNAVTFHVHWTRVEDSRPSRSGDMDLTLQAGETATLDVVPLSPAACGIAGRALQVAVEYLPPFSAAQRLVATDVWLVERLPDGTERSEALALQAPYYQSTPFYFKRLTDRNTALDVFGSLIVLRREGYNEVKIRPSRRLSAGGIITAIESTVQLKPGEVVSLELPKFGQSATDPFFTRSFSIRIRSQEAK